VYHHVDQSWKSQPAFMSDDVVQGFAQRLDQYVNRQRLSDFSVIFHGGEPLLFGVDRLASAALAIRSIVRRSCRLEFSLQTNGVRLGAQDMAVLQKVGISVSLSLDGPRAVHDRHRLDHQGKSSFDDSIAALHRLLSAPAGFFRGVIAVIDPQVAPGEVLQFFAQYELPRLDLLLPDATHLNPPPGRAADQDIYRRWLCEAFDLWLSRYSFIPIRWFDAVLASRVGVPSPTDIMGFGTVSLLVIETDGSYTDHDVFKVVASGEAQLSGNVLDTEIESVAEHPKVRLHGQRLTLAGVAAECRTCPAVEACGGGCVMHRAHPTRGLDAPTVYCAEMYGLLETATRLLRRSLQVDSDSPAAGQVALLARGQGFVEQCRQWRVETESKADAMAAARGIERGEASAAAILLGDANDPNVSQATLDSEKRIWLGAVRVQSSDPRLVSPFANTVARLSASSLEVQHGVAMLDAVTRSLACMGPEYPRAIAALISDVIFVSTLDPTEQGIFSFSDDEAPNVLYVAPYAGGKPLPAEDIADSILHEFMHQVLHHIERHVELLFDREHPRFPAPWRSGLRKSGGFLHGTFVFAHLAEFWRALAVTADTENLRHKASTNAKRAGEQAAYGLAALRTLALLTRDGERLLDEIASLVSSDEIPKFPPGPVA